MNALVGLSLGGAVGVVLGLTGAGGSIFAVPLLMWGLGWPLPQAAPVALLAVCGASAFGTIAARDPVYLRYRAATLMALFGWCTAPLGLAAARRLPVSWLTALFAAVLVLVAVRMFRQARRAPAEAAVVRAQLSGDGSVTANALCRLDGRTGRFIWTRPCVLLISATGAATGFLAGLLGVGGGFVIVPALRTGTELSIHSAVATSLMAIALISAGTIGVALLQGLEMPWLLALPFVAGSLGGMLAGRRLAARIAGPRLQQMFSGLMLVVAVILMRQAIQGR